MIFKNEFTNGYHYNEIILNIVHFSHAIHQDIDIHKIIYERAIIYHHTLKGEVFDKHRNDVTFGYIFYEEDGNVWEFAAIEKINNQYHYFYYEYEQDEYKRNDDYYSFFDTLCVKEKKLNINQLPQHIMNAIKYL